MAGGHLLQAVVPDRGGRTQPSGDVALIDDVALLGGVSPHAGETIGLKLQPDRKSVSLAGVLLLESPNLPLDPEDLLHVVPDLVSNHIGLSEFARAPNLLLSSSKNPKSR